MTDRVLVTCHHMQRNFEPFRSELEQYGMSAKLPNVFGQQLDADGMRNQIKGCVAVIAGDDVIDASVLEAGRESGLKTVIKWGVGTDSIDKETAAFLDIPVYNTPGVFADEVADLAMTFLLLLTRRLHLMHTSVLEGGWRQIEGRSLNTMTAGIVGLGSNGRAIAERCAAFRMKVLGCDILRLSEAEKEQAGVEQVSFEDLLEASDAVLIACNLTPANRHMISKEALARMREGSYLVNVGRGPLVDETALIEALQSGHLRGAGLDVFEEEPLPAYSPLRSFETCVLGTHSGSNTAEAVARTNRMTIDILLDALGYQKAVGFTPNRVA